LRIYGTSDPAKGYLDLNGHNQTIALMQSGNADAKIFNSAVGTVSTLTIGYGNEQANRSCSFQLMDNQGTGGILALTKIITAPYLIAPAYTVLATNCAQELTGLCTYSGDTTVSGGSLILSSTAAVSPYSAYRLSTSNYALLKLNYAGSADVRQLWIDGVQQPNGVYGAGTPGIDPASTGTITVTGADPKIVFSRSGQTLTLSWAGPGYKLQFKKELSASVWCDYPAGTTSPVNVSIGSGSQYFRLSK
jgi:autotransporter-associated beta strand protein